MFGSVEEVQEPVGGPDHAAFELFPILLAELPVDAADMEPFLDVDGEGVG